MGILVELLVQNNEPHMFKYFYNPFILHLLRMGPWTINHFLSTHKQELLDIPINFIIFIQNMTLNVWPLYNNNTWKIGIHICV